MTAVPSTGALSSWATTERKPILFKRGDSLASEVFAPFTDNGSWTEKFTTVIQEEIENVNYAEQQSMLEI